MRFARAAHHLSDGELLRLVDADGEGQELARFQAHVATCPRCDDGLHSLRRAAGLVHRRLDVIQAPPRTLRAPAPPTRAPAAAPPWSRTWARAAVLLLACAGALVAVAPLRARIRDWAATAWHQLAGTRPAPTPPAAVPAAAAAPAAVLSFAPAGPELRLVFATRQAAGTLLVRRADGPSALLEIRPADASVVPLASERLLEIRNRPGSRSGYVVQVPAGTSEVVVTIGREPPRSFGPAALAAGVRIDLRPGAGVRPGPTGERPPPGGGAR